MGKSAPSAPAAPDPTTVANAQSAANQQTAEFQSTLNNYNVNGPYGQVTWNQNPTTNQWTQNTQLSPAEQNIFNGETSAAGSALGIANTQLGNVASALGQTPTQAALQFGAQGGPIQSSYGSGGQIQSSFNPGQSIQGSVGQTPVQTGIGSQAPIDYGVNGGQRVQGQVSGASTYPAMMQAEQGVFNQQYSLLQPQMQQQQEQQQAQLAAQGLNPNDAAYQNSMTLFNNGRAQELGQLAGNAVSAGQAEQNTLYGQNLSSSQFANQAAGQQFSQGLQSQQAYNAAQNQAYTQALGSGSFTNSAEGQLFNQGLQAGDFANTAAGQQYAQNLGQATFANQAQAQGNAQNQNAATFANQAEGQQYAQNQSNATLNNQASQQQFQNQAYAQQLPINEFDALMSSGQVGTAPTSQFSATQVSPTNVLGAYQLNQNAQDFAYRQQMQNYQSGLGGLFNLGSAAMSAYGL